MFQLVICPNCDTENEISENQPCKHCGQLLRYPIDQTLTDTAGLQLRQQILAIVSDLQSIVELDTHEIALEFVDTQEILKLTYAQPIILGRAQKTPAPDVTFVNLTDYNAHGLGLSREHARLHLHDEGYVIKDLDSANGTSINGQLLTPNYNYPLNHGDIVSLARLAFIFHCT